MSVKEKKIMPLTRPDGGIAFTPEDRAWQIYLAKFKHQMNEAEIKEKLQFTDEEFDFCKTIMITMKRRFDAKFRKKEMQKK